MFGFLPLSDAVLHGLRAEFQARGSLRDTGQALAFIKRMSGYNELFYIIIPHVKILDSGWSRAMD